MPGWKECSLQDRYRARRCGSQNKHKFSGSIEERVCSQPTSTRRTCIITWPNDGSENGKQLCSTKQADISLSHMITAAKPWPAECSQTQETNTQNTKITDEQPTRLKTMGPKASKGTIIIYWDLNIAAALRRAWSLSLLYDLLPMCRL